MCKEIEVNGERKSKKNKIKQKSISVYKSKTTLYAADVLELFMHLWGLKFWLNQINIPTTAHTQCTPETLIRSSNSIIGKQ